MSRSRAPLLTSAVFCLFALTATLIPSLGRAQTAAHVVISEVMYDPPQAGTDTGYEWIELFNPTSAPVDLSGWTLEDNTSQDVLPGFILNPGEYLVIAATASGFASNYPSYAGNLLTLGLAGSIGNGLSNTGDRLLLLDAVGVFVDTMCYGSDTTYFSLPRSGALAGHSVARVPSEGDTDTASDWFDQVGPTPGGPGGVSTPTQTGTATPTLTQIATATGTTIAVDTATATVTPTQTDALAETATATTTWAASTTPTPTATALPRVLLSEVMYDPVGSEPGAEWVELYNPMGVPVNLDGWKLGDNSVVSDILPAFTLPPGQYLVVASMEAVFRTENPGFTGNLISLGSAIGSGLNNSGDVVRLSSPGGVIIVDAMSFGGDTTAFTPACPTVPEGHSLARVPSDRDTDTREDWVAQGTPNPGAAGSAPPPALTPTPTRTATAAATPTLTITPDGATWTATAQPVPIRPGDVIINEIMQNPTAVLDKDGEWFEVYNVSVRAIDLNDWTVKDAGSERHKIAHGGPLWLPPRGYLVLGRNADSSANGRVPVAYRYAGFTLGNTADEIILLDGAGTEIDRVAYDGGPTFPAPDGASMQLIRPDLDNALGANWRVSPDPWPGSTGDRGSPGTPNHTARIQGYAYEDVNGNRTREADEPGIADVVVSLNNGRTTLSIASGWYGFADLAPGTYEVSETQPSGYTSTTPDRRTVTVGLGALVPGPSFGEQRLPPTVTPTAGPSPTPTPSPGPGSCSPRYCTMHRKKGPTARTNGSKSSIPVRPWPRWTVGR